MTGWFESVKNTAEKTKLRGNIILESKKKEGRKKEFGIQFYDVLTNDKQRLLGAVSSSLTVFKKSPDDEDLGLAFERANNDVRVLKGRKEEFQQKLDIIEIKGSHTMPDVTLQQKISKNAKALTDAGNSTKIRAQMVIIDREIKIRKENFGVEVYDFVVDKTSDTEKKGLKKSISKVLTRTSINEHEKEIQKVIDVAKNDIEAQEARVISLERQIALLDSEMEPLTSP